ncbi:hypothetical protein [Nitrosomonas sp. Nm58]|uniref:hypothetical protein n=1 Tax=Nitrosomonas sp. Nm58 TaxID=200126 RepID=UPI000B836C69|nr:hypothetical protein [Nitrosomonas sp. Nm58]
MIRIVMAVAIERIPPKLWKVGNDMNSDTCKKAHHRNQHWIEQEQDGRTYNAEQSRAVECKA